MLKVVPGPTATQMAIYLGRARAGFWGGLFSGTLFILPAFIIVVFLSSIYKEAVAMPGFSGLFVGMQLAAIAVIAESIWKMSKPYQKAHSAWIIALISAVSVMFKPGLEPFLILIFGFLMAYQDKWMGKKFVITPVPLLLWELFLVCFKAGTFSFGTGLAIVPMIQADVVTKHHWLTSTEFLDALAIGQITPGPVIVTASFIGAHLYGVVGALVATVGITLTSFLNILFIFPRIESRLVKSTRVTSFTDGAFPAVLGSLIGILIRLIMTCVSSWMWAVLLIVLVTAMLRLRPPSWALIFSGGLVGFLLVKLF
jgi:chromate transporter